MGFRYDQHRAMGGVGEGRCSGTGVSEVTPEEILRKQVGESINPPRISEVKVTERNGVTEEDCQAKVSSKVREKSLKARKRRALRC